MFLNNPFLASFDMSDAILSGSIMLFSLTIPEADSSWSRLDFLLNVIDSQITLFLFSNLPPSYQLLLRWLMAQLWPSFWSVWEATEAWSQQQDSNQPNAILFLHIFLSSALSLLSYLWKSTLQTRRYHAHAMPNIQQTKTNSWMTYSWRFYMMNGPITRLFISCPYSARHSIPLSSLWQVLQDLQ